MHIGIALTDAARVDIPAVAQRAESLGFESIWAPEHLVYPVREEDGDV
ncbi:MAG: LLM class F420-dependent oxidoreductase, partial [SAR324 cluster bacterium]|nr:LLM class F420-dependent oxidoreductase [SAR324 cluster bacterium]